MKYMTTAQIRESYLKFFEEKGCKRLPSSSLIPEDPSLLLTSAGMVQFKPYFLHVKEFDPDYIGATTAQKCVRTNDIDIIGTTGRHLSFFEMMGNFSFGKYFKKEMCAWALEYSLKVLELPFDKLYFTVFEDDDETIEIWKSLGVDSSHISRLGEDDNFWRAGPTGPCGPCSELYYDQGPDYGCGKPDCAPGCDCDRFLEYWNCVFTQFDGQEDGSLAPLPTKNIDTGLGLERVAAIMQGVQSNYETDVLRSLVGVGERLSGHEYKGTFVGENEKQTKQNSIDLSLRICADHSRSVCFMIADGILPGNEGRGYVLRRLLRRAVLHGHFLGIEGPFIKHYFAQIIDLMGDVYPEIVDNRELIEGVIQSEEERFGNRLKMGQEYLEDALSTFETGKVLSGDIAFKLHDTYGFPIEVTEEICQGKGITVDREGFNLCMEKQRNLARAATKDDAEAAWSTYHCVEADILKEVGATRFVGYDCLEHEARVLALIKEGERVSSLQKGEKGQVVLDITPFYAEMGGQVGDTGFLKSTDKIVKVLDTKTPAKGLTCHQVCVESGEIAEGEKVQASVDVRRRSCIERNHTATHILHAALRKVLGEHVNQAGSYVGPDRLRFDFTHFQAVTPDQIREVENLANEQIMLSTKLDTYETSLDDARSRGVTALFGEKYGDTVRVVDAGDFSRELCAGCHVNNTSEIGFVKIVNEGSVGANARRLEAVTSYEALAYVNKLEDELRAAAQDAKVQPLGVRDKVQQLLSKVKELEGEIKELKTFALTSSSIDLDEYVVDAGYPLLVGQYDNLDTEGMRLMWDDAKQALGNSSAMVIATVSKGKPVIMAAGTDGAIEKGFHAGKIIKEIAPLIKGGGGGKPSMAQAGGKDASGIEKALQAAKDICVGK